jgi:Kef-type K+ transport system membrane component KefB
MDFAAGPMDVLEYIRSNAVALPQLTKFALRMAFIFGVLALSRRLRLPAVVGLLFSGVVLGYAPASSTSKRAPRGGLEHAGFPQPPMRT